MPPPNPAAFDFLSTRRSRPARALTAPAPDRAALLPILTAALRVPDHGKLEPWRLVVLEGAALPRLAALAAARGAALGLDDERTEKGVSQFRDSPLCVAVIESPKGFDRIPAIEQTYSAGCVALSLVNAALAAGWGACWLTGWPAYDAVFLTDGLALGPDERLVGFVHIGTETAAPPERPRPDLGRVVTWAAD
jgi:nitroreductase